LAVRERILSFSVLFFFFIVLGSDSEGKLEVCVRCYCLKNKETAILEFKKKVDETKNDRLILWYAFVYCLVSFFIYIFLLLPFYFYCASLCRYNTLISLRKEIENLMPDLRGLVCTLTDNNVLLDQLSSSNDLSFIEAVFDVQAKANDNAKVIGLILHYFLFFFVGLLFVFCGILVG
jgi:hypothetical protein